MTISSEHSRKSAHCLPGLWPRPFKMKSAPGASPAACVRCGYLAWFTVQTKGGVPTIKPTVRLVPADALDKLIGSMNMPPGKQLAIDFSEVDLLPSACLGKLVRLQKTLESRLG